jgi:hypothetical protein
MNLSTAAGLGLLGALLAAGPVGLRAEGPPAGEDRAAALVHKLGDDSYRVREEAARELLRLGPEAESALRRGLGDADPEVGKRCGQLLPLVVGRDATRKVAAFLEDRDDRGPPPAGWVRFRKAVGGGEAARTLFAAMYRAHGPLLEAAERDPKAAAGRLGARASAVREALGELDCGAPTRADVAVLLFVAGDERIPADAEGPEAVAAALGELEYRPRLVKDFHDDPAAHALLVTFLRRRTAPAALAGTFGLALRLDVRECVAEAASAATNRALPPAARAAALVLAGRWGGKELIGRLEPLLDDPTPVGTAVVRKRTLSAEVGDVALAALVQLSGQALSDFGFPYTEAVPGLRGLPPPNRLGFADLAGREAARKKWRQWAAARKK